MHFGGLIPSSGLRKSVFPYAYSPDHAKPEHLMAARVVSAKQHGKPLSQGVLQKCLLQFGEGQLQGTKFMEVDIPSLHAEEHRPLNARLSTPMSL